MTIFFDGEAVGVAAAEREREQGSEKGASHAAAPCDDRASDEREATRRDRSTATARLRGSRSSVVVDELQVWRLQKRRWRVYGFGAWMRMPS
ncbi:MAG: hypothetical protein ACXVDD_26870, partial [Polyangia bacterium]